MEIKIYLADGGDRKFRQVYPHDSKKRFTLLQLKKKGPHHFLEGKYPMVFEPVDISLRKIYENRSPEVKFPFIGQGTLYEQLAQGIAKSPEIHETEIVYVILTLL